MQVCMHMHVYTGVGRTNVRHLPPEPPCSPGVDDEVGVDVLDGDVGVQSGRHSAHLVHIVSLTLAIHHLRAHRTKKNEQNTTQQNHQIGT
jgi:hypothetical protein